MKTQENFYKLFRSGQRIIIPFFQRNYVWKEKDWEMFLDTIKDLIDNQHNEYSSFLGALILKKEKEELILIDGQQRITTIILFYYAYCEIFQKQELFKLNTFLPDMKTFILNHNVNDKKVFESIINGKEIEDKAKNSNIYRCYDYFKKAIEGDIEQYQLKENHYILYKLSFVEILLDSSDDEQKIFDILNSGGVRLTVAELLKNFLFKIGEEKEFKEYWQDIFENSHSEYWDFEINAIRDKSTVDLFLQSYLIIKRFEEDPDLDSENSFIKFEDLYKKFKELIGSNKANRVKYFKDIAQKAILFKNKFNLDCTKKDINFENYNFNRFLLFCVFTKNLTPIPYLFYIIIENKDNNTEINNISKVLERYLFRRLIYKETTKGYNKIFMKFIKKKIKTADALNKEISDFEEVSNMLPSLNKEKFKNISYENRQGRIILYLLEDLELSGATVQQIPIDKIELEHIIPQDYEKWSNVINKENKDCIYNIGNMTLISPYINKSISKSEWKIKLNGNSRNCGLKKLNFSKNLEKYLELELFTTESVKTRNEEIFELIKKYYS